MPRATAVRTYGRHARKTKAVVTNLFVGDDEDDQVTAITEKISEIRIDIPDYRPVDDERLKSSVKRKSKPPAKVESAPEPESEPPSPAEEAKLLARTPVKKPTQLPSTPPNEAEIDAEKLVSTSTKKAAPKEAKQLARTPPAPPKPQSTESAEYLKPSQRILTWGDLCPPGDRIEKIAEASYAEVYRITNERGTSIIKVVRLESSIKPQTKAQEKSGLVDEEPHSEADLGGEVRISELLADIPGFVVYKERYVVRGKTTKELLETHQAFHRKMKRKDPDRLQYYPSPSRYLNDTEFLVLELGDAGTSLEDFECNSIDQVWDVLLLVAIALGRAEHQVAFEHRDLHEGNLCVRQVREPKAKDDPDSPLHFGYSGLDITILDYGLSRAEDPDTDNFDPIAFDLEKDLSLFTSTHAPQCKVYRRMRSYLIKGDRVHLPPRFHNKPLTDDESSWADHHPYTNVLWLAYIYEYLTKHFKGPKKDLTSFKKQTTELWEHLNPDAPAEVLSFPSAAEIVRFMLEAGWVSEKQLVGDPDGDEDGVDHITQIMEDVSIIEAQVDRDKTQSRRSPRRRQAARS